MPTNFSDLGVRADIVACLTELGVVEPYPIQTAALPDALAGLDLFAQSPTGSGKTLAFIIPVLMRIGRAVPRRPRALVLAPTRELAEQIAEVARPLARIVNRRVVSVYGGVGYRDQLNALSRGVDLVVGCPGRLTDLRDRGALDLSEVEIVVVDEADRMADMGFLAAVRGLLSETPAGRQTILFSATRNSDVERLVRDYQKNPRRHHLDGASDDVGSRRHEFWRARKESRAQLTAQLVGAHSSSIVFCRTKRGADRLAQQLSAAGVSAAAIHGDRTQAQRDRALAQFRARQVQVLVGTDVASRGIHVDNVDCVVHFDPPDGDDTYIHRSGRTGRAGASGLVVSLLTPDQESGARSMQRRLGIDSPLSTPAVLAGAIAIPQARPPQGRPPACANGGRRPEGDRSVRAVGANGAPVTRGRPNHRRHVAGRGAGAESRSGRSSRGRHSS